MVEVAARPQEKTQGLMCRASVPPGTGMLFPYDRPTTGGFWMYNTYVPLDILYIDADGRVVSMKTMSPCPKVPPESIDEWRARCAGESGDYRPDSAYLAALELPQGWLAENGFDADSMMNAIVTW